MDFQLAVVLDKAQLPESVHKETDSRSRCAHHFCQRFLANVGNYFIAPSFFPEIAGYGTVRSIAETLGEDNHVSLLEETLEEEKETDEKLTELAEQINTEANEIGDDRKKAVKQDKQKSRRVA